MTFPNKVGDHADTDEILREELKAAGIQTIQEAGGRPPEYMAELLRSQSGEVKTSVIGVLHGWTFKRAWYYWIASGPGIEITAAERLQESHGKTVRASGDAGCRGPRFWFKGLACGSYHVDDAEGLKALADTIKGLVDGGNKSDSAAEIAALRTELEEARKDAERYAFAKTLEGQIVVMETLKNLGASWLDEKLDEAIDAAKEQGK